VDSNDETSVQLKKLNNDESRSSERISIRGRRRLSSCCRGEAQDRTGKTAGEAPATRRAASIPTKSRQVQAALSLRRRAFAPASWRYHHTGPVYAGCASHCSFSSFAALFRARRPRWPAPRSMSCRIDDVDVQSRCGVEGTKALCIGGNGEDAKMGASAVSRRVWGSLDLFDALPGLRRQHR